jgi:hypothetical protein
VRIDCSLCGNQMLDLHLCLSASVNVRYILHTQHLELYNKNLVVYISIHHYFCLFSTAPFLSYIIYSSDGQHKGPQCQH